MEKTTTQAREHMSAPTEGIENSVNRPELQRARKRTRSQNLKKMQMQAQESGFTDQSPQKYCAQNDLVRSTVYRVEVLEQVLHSGGVSCHQVDSLACVVAASAYWNPE